MQVKKICRMLNGEHSAKFLTFIKLPFSIKTFVLSILSGLLCFVYFKWPLKTGFTVTDIDITPCSADRTDVNCVHTFRNTVKPVLSPLKKKKETNLDGRATGSSLTALCP